MRENYLGAYRIFRTHRMYHPIRTATHTQTRFRRVWSLSYRDDRMSGVVFLIGIKASLKLIILHLGSLQRYDIIFHPTVSKWTTFDFHLETEMLDLVPPDGFSCEVWADTNGDIHEHVPSRIN
jgi:hypothetical protein